MKSFDFKLSQPLEKQPPTKRVNSLRKMLSSEIYTNTTTMTATATAMATATATASSSTATTTNASSPTPAVLKPKKKKRRPKKRKRAGHATSCNNNNNSTTTNNNNNKGTHNQLEPPLLGCVSSTTTSTTSVSGGRKCKAQYFQHDNRAAYFAKYESFHFTAQATTAAALNYAAVAKKFKPLRPMLASGAKKNRRTAAARKALGECACVCQNSHMTQCPQEACAVKKTADLHQQQCRERKCRPNNATTMTTPPMKININGQALPALLELLKQTPSTWLQTLLLGAAGSAATMGR